MIVPLAAAVGGAVGYGVGSVLQAAAARVTSGPRAILQPLYLLGICCDAVAWLLSLVALQGLPLFLVEALLAGSLAVTAVLGSVFLRATLTRRDKVAIVVIVLALVGVALSSSAEPAGPEPGWFMIAMLIGLAVVAAAAAMAYPGGRPVLMALLAGGAVSGSALGARGVDLGAGPSVVLRSPVSWTILGFAFLGVLLYSRALERGDVGPVTAIVWVVQIVIPGVFGVLVLGDRAKSGWELTGLVAVATATAGCVVLAAGQARSTANSIRAT